MKLNSQKTHPTLGSPTTPIFRLLLGLPSKIRSSLTTFFGGIFFTYNDKVQEKERTQMIWKVEFDEILLMNKEP